MSRSQCAENRGYDHDSGSESTRSLGLLSRLASRPAERGFLVLGTDVSRDNGVGVFSVQILEGLGRVAPGQKGTVLAITAPSDLELPAQWNLRRARGHLRYVKEAFELALRNHPSEILALHLSLLPVAFVAARLSSARLTLVAHGAEITLSRRRLERWCGYRVDRLAANSRRTTLEVEALFRDKSARRFEPVRLLYPTWDHGNSSVDPARRTVAREMFGFDQHDIVLLTVGRMDSSERRKGHDRVLAVLPSLLASSNHIRYLVVGQGDDQARLAALAEELGVRHRVTFAGYVEDIADCYAACDLYVMPSTQEGFGIVFLEALASGRPVVAGGIDGSIEALCWGELGFLCDPLDPESVAGAIRCAVNALGGSAHRVDSTFLRTQVEQRFGVAAFDNRLGELLGSSFGSVSDSGAGTSGMPGE
jgi:glycosyltransferase involved in cell wall biosynthesis